VWKNECFQHYGVLVIVAAEDKNAVFLV
jgi:hypothetical protein